MNNNSHDSAAAAGALAGMGLFLLIIFALSILIIAGLWKMFTKAGKPGWAAIIPIYNMIVLIEIGGKPIWWIILMFIPVVSLVMSIIVLAAVAKNFGRGIGTTLGLIFFPFIFYPILGFGSARYGTVPATQ